MLFRWPVHDALEFVPFLAEAGGDELALCFLRGARVGRGDDLGDGGAAYAVLAGDGVVALAEPGGGDLGVSFGVRSWHTPPGRLGAVRM